MYKPQLSDFVRFWCILVYIVYGFLYTEGTNCWGQVLVCCTHSVNRTSSKSTLFIRIKHLFDDPTSLDAPSCMVAVKCQVKSWNSLIPYAALLSLRPRQLITRRQRRGRRRYPQFKILVGFRLISYTFNP